MTRDRAPLDAFLRRLDRVSMRLQRHGGAPPATGLTAPDQPSGERWEWGQVWAHLAEFVPYWISQMRLILEAPGTEPVLFGRTKADPERIAAIERDRHRPPPEMWLRLHGQLGGFRAFLEDIPAEAWSKRGHHPTAGTMDIRRIVDDFVVGHLEAHADQLDGLVAGAS